MNRLKWQWEENPMLPALVCLSAGVWAGSEFKTEKLVCCGFFIALTAVFLFFFRRKHVRIRAVVRTILCWGFCLGAGAGLSVFRAVSDELPGHSAFYGILTDCGEKTENDSRRCLARIVRVRKPDGHWVEVQGSAVLNFRGQTSPEFRSGQCIVSGIPLRGIPAPALPGEFNAQKWLRSQGVFWQANLEEKSWKPAGTKTNLSLRSLALACRQHLENTLLHHLPAKEDAAMLSALLLGIRRKLDPELKEAYSSAGLTHILAVSGMHVALIFGFFSFLLKGLKTLPGGRFLFSILITSLLWFYALVTGLSPSVLRAVCLFSVMQFSDVLRRPSLPLNNLCFTSILLILADQQILFDLGYQLSFAAVYGIISYQKYFNPGIPIKNRLLRTALENLTVTLAASISTMPLILYHFHRFPVYFLISNLFAVPFSNLLIYAGILLLAISPMGWLADLTGITLHHAISLLNGFVVLINKLPGSSLDNIYPSFSEFTLFLVLLLCLQAFLCHRKRLLLHLTLSAGFLLSLVLFMNAWIFLDEKEGLFVLRHRKDWLLMRKQKDLGILFPLSSNSAPPLFLKKGFQLESLQLKSPTCTTLLPASEGKNDTKLFVINKYKIMILNGYIKGFLRNQPIRIDLLAVDNTGEKSLLQALHFFQPRMIFVNWDKKRISRFRMKNQIRIPVRSFAQTKIIRIEPEAGTDLPEVNREIASARFR